MTPTNNTEVDAWFAQEQLLPDVLAALRGLLLDYGLGEALKWRQPCYTVEGRNVAILGARKGGCVLSLFSGALLDDPEGLLLSAGPNTRAARLLSFASMEELDARDAPVRALLTQAVVLAREGKRVRLEPVQEPVPDTLLRCFDADPELKTAFEALTPGRRRGYLLHFNGTKSVATCAARIERARPRIVVGKGLLDCICGRSARMPRCDGSHKDV